MRCGKDAVVHALDSLLHLKYHPKGLRANDLEMVSMHQPQNILCCLYRLLQEPADCVVVVQVDAEVSCCLLHSHIRLQNCWRHQGRFIRTRGRCLWGILRCGPSAYVRRGGTSLALAVLLEVHGLHGTYLRLSTVHSSLGSYGHHLLSCRRCRVIHGVVVLNHRAKTCKRKGGRANWKPRRLDLGFWV